MKAMVSKHTSVSGCMAAACASVRICPILDAALCLAVSVCAVCLRITALPA